jgi:homogentisate 1,2-dioxygenase
LAFFFKSDSTIASLWHFNSYIGQNSPQACPYGLYAEQLSGTAFTVPRTHNLRSWLYRIRPSVSHLPYKPLTQSSYAPGVARSFETVQVPAAEEPTVKVSAPFVSTPNQLRWSPFPIPAQDQPTNFVEGLKSIAAAGDPSTRGGLAILIYAANKSMEKEAFYNADADMLIGE